MGQGRAHMTYFFARQLWTYKDLQRHADQSYVWSTKSSMVKLYLPHLPMTLGDDRLCRK